MVKIGIEFEMVIYINIDREVYTMSKPVQELKNVFGNYIEEYKTDYSVRAKEIIPECFKSMGDGIEWVTRPIAEEEIPDFLKVLKKLTDIASINEFDSNKDFAIFFNSSTGTHIHYSDEYIRNKTKELYLYGDTLILNKIVKRIKEKCKYPTIKQDFSRKYTDSRKHFTSTRYKQLNISDSRYKGTIEFRMLNLHGIKTAEFVECMFHIIYELVIDTVREFNFLLAMKIYNKTIFAKKIEQIPVIDENYITVDNAAVDEYILN